MIKFNKSYTLIVVIVILVIVILFISILLNKKQKIELLTTELYDYNAPYLLQGASSVDSEKQFASTGEQWKGQPNKCYSCEKDMQARCGNGNSCIYKASKTKCFDC
jgi:hypothetical protein